MPFTIPVGFVGYDGKKYVTAMTFEHSTERDFALTLNRKALKECRDPDKLREVAGNLLEGWAMMNTALQGMMKENIELRQALDVRDSSLEAAEVLLNEAVQALQKYEKQSRKSRKGLWPWRR